MRIVEVVYVVVEWTSEGGESEQESSLGGSVARYL